MFGASRSPCCIWEFPKIRGTLFWCPYKKDPPIQGTILGSPIFGNSHLDVLLGTWTLVDWVFHSSICARSLSDGRCHDSAEAAVAAALKVGWERPFPTPDL